MPMDTNMRMAGAIIPMTEAAGNLALLRLMTWLSPVFPVGGFSYSHGIERAVEDGQIDGAEALADWVLQLLHFGSGWNDAVLFAESWRRACSGGDLVELAGLGEALAGSEERHRETLLLGAAFLQATAAWRSLVHDHLPAKSPYGVAVGAMAGAHGVPLEAALGAFLQAFASGLVQAAIRLGVVGQSGAVAILARLESPVLEIAGRAAKASLDDLGSATLLSEVAAMRHEIQHTRLFRT